MGELANGMLRRWAFVNGGAFAAFLVCLWLLEVPAKMAAEPNLRNYILPAILSGIAWLVLAVLRFLILERESRQ